MESRFRQRMGEWSVQKKNHRRRIKKGRHAPLFISSHKSAWWPYSALAVSAPIARAYFLPEKRISFSDFLPSLLTVVTAELRSGV